MEHFSVSDLWKRGIAGFKAISSLLLAVCLFSVSVKAQTKIGGVPGPINPYAYLQLGDSGTANKGLLVARVTLTATTQAAPLGAHVAGMVVYNLVAVNDVVPGLYYNDGTRWVLIAAVQLGQSAYLRIADTAAMLAPYLNDAQNGLHKSGQIAKLGGALIEPTNIGTSIANPLSISGLQSGTNNDSILVVDPLTNNLRFISKASLLNALYFNNGLTRNGDSVQLGGTLTHPTVINTDPVNTLSIKGLPDGQFTDSIVTVAPNTGTLRKVSPAALGTTMVKQISLATAGQTVFTTPMVITSLDKVQVFRNGVEVPFNATVGTSQITLILFSDTNNACFDGDEIKIYQWQ
ncbi:hypothetical protein [Taibaiella soli]|uniref:Uncharacterized protein n=1 Tax=Taibaiella soli TaxID=1649169 RepID=A0A2W2AU40_9BACT|nr:hypothetical protein [Taibaiella soli]PZF71494.1 hypothetical protein DN068_18175 [Taibaiella soli]